MNKPLNLYEEFGTDDKLCTEGKWIKIGDENDPMFLISFKDSFKNKAYLKALEKESKDNKNGFRSNTVTLEKAENIEKRIFVKSILKNWKNVTDKNGNVLEFNEKNAMKLLNDLPVIYKLLSSEASDYGNFKNEIMEDEAKN